MLTVNDLPFPPLSPDELENLRGRLGYEPGYPPLATIIFNPEPPSNKPLDKP